MDADDVVVPLGNPPSRHFELDGPVNFRDLGGYPVRDGRTVRWRTIFRSDGLHSMSAADLALLLDQLGLSSVIDLRSGDEVELVGRGPLGETEVVLHHVPIFDETRRLADRLAGGLVIGDMYVQMIESAAPRFVQALEIIARTNSPLVFHCAAGKDRTGLLGAVLLELLGVDDDDIAEDYAHSARSIALLKERWAASAAAKAAKSAEGDSPSKTGARRSLPPGMPRLPRGAEGRRVAEELLSARPATILALLGTMRDRFGSVGEWAADHGFSQSDANRLRDRLLV
ncbi:MAG: protein-tyrosine phosphatase [Acidimicrobiia bacterium]|jgi:protein-tyrosine phosphatase|nr:protein-tyrosine phosphatase [Acidimicrobiia bacterium]